MPCFRRLSALTLGLSLSIVSPPARAFCGFYVGGAGSKLYNHATQVVLMREGLRTVLSMANNYDGPPDGFAMVVPVPVVLQKSNVKTLSAELFDRIDQLDAPRLVEYWEQDPCPRSEGYGYEFSDDPLAAGGFGPNDATIRVRPGPVAVKILNRFSVGEYQVLILSAQDSLGLDTWLRENGYAIPPGAEPVLRPYVQAGMKFFVAKIDPSKVHFENGKATLSPLRFHYDSETFALPIRLGLLSSPGTQDLVVHVLARGQRYEAANYDNVVIPTNLDLSPAAQGAFGTFYAALFDRTLAAHPGAMMTEYAWDAGSCDPCPTPPLDEGDLDALGREVLPSAASAGSSSGYGGGFVLSRLHARYGKDNAGADLVFRAAPPISGGRESRDEAGALEQGAHPDGVNNFQARYAIRHPWTGPVTCAEPRRGIWGANPHGQSTTAMAAQNLAFAPRGSVDITIYLVQPPPGEGGFAPGSPGVTFFPGGALGQPAPPYGGCAACAVGEQEPAGPGWLWGLGLGLGAIGARRRMRPSRRVAPR
ncbi:MAG: DUF2330 domain-containing protein [Byssovorax sp.]